MTEQITNKDYITINRDGVFVDGKPATKYHGKEIAKLEQIKQVFETPGTEDILEILPLYLGFKILFVSIYHINKISIFQSSDLPVTKIVIVISTNRKNSINSF